MNSATITIAEIGVGAPVKIGYDGLWFPRKACRRSKTCGYTHACKSMSHDSARAAREKWDADKKRRDADEEARGLQERNDERLRLLGMSRNWLLLAWTWANLSN